MMLYLLHHTHTPVAPAIRSINITISINMLKKVRWGEVGWGALTVSPGFSRTPLKG